MNKNNNHSKFFDLLCGDDPKYIKEFLYTNGKDPKPVCPIQFINEKEENKE